MEKRKRIYYLDDDLDDLYIFKDVAEELGHDVTIFVNGQMFLRALNTQPLPDLIFLDIVMPVFEGEEIFHIIQRTEKWKHIPIVMISGHSPKSLIRHYLEAGANYVMKKPAVISDFRVALEQVLSIDWEKFQAYS
ncbi:MAG TPA: response regulator [Flavobacterium sp.]|jgi:CheY-like chemotaxis protein